MEDTIINVNTLPETIHRRLLSKRARVREENGIVLLIPIQDSGDDVWAAVEQLQEMFADSCISTERYVEQKQIDKELER